MGTFDIILLIILGLGLVKGYNQGFVVELFSFLAFFLGLFIALELTIPVSTGLFGSSNYFNIGAIVVFIALFILLSITIKAAAKAIKNVIDFTLLGTLDNILGAVAGVFKSAFIISIIFWVFDSVGFNALDDYSNEAVIFPYIVNIGPSIFEWFSGVLPIIQDLIDSMEKLAPDSNSVLT